MLGFKLFVEEQQEKENREVEQGFIDGDGYPTVVVLKNPANSAIGPDGVPAAYTGGFERPQKVNEDFGSGKWIHRNDNAHLGDDVDEVHDHLVDSDKTAAGEEKHIHNYTVDSYWLNKRLHNAHQDGEKLSGTVSNHDTKALDAALKRNSLKHDLHVYTGVKFHPGEVAAKHPEGHVHLAAYTSTTIDKDSAPEFAREDDEGNAHILHIHLKKGQKGKYIAHMSANDHEHEYLLPRSTTLKIHPKKEIHRSGGINYHIWHAEVVSKTTKKKAVE